MSKKGKRGDLESGDQLQRPVPRVEFGPRWCRFCEINKPDRTHHCRHCGTCVMAFDRESKRSMVADKQITASGSANVSAGEIIK
jgi:hypothetical protein